VEFQLDDPATTWTRALQVRYGLNTPVVGRTATLNGLAVGQTDQLAVAALATETSRQKVACAYTDDGNVLQVLLTEPDLPGRYFSDRWLVLPGGLPDDQYVSVAVLPGFRQYALEKREGDGSARPEPKAGTAPVYDSTGSLGPAPRPKTEPVKIAEGTINKDPSFEERGRYWQMGSDIEGRWTKTQVYSGEVAVDLTCLKGKIHLVQTNPEGSRALALKSKAEYSVSLWAKCLAGQGQVHVNFYAPQPGCDFPHAFVDLPPDGQWHQYTVTIPTGDLPQRPAEYRVFWPFDEVVPSLRVWTLERDEQVYVDQVEVRAK
jgi:hypothetical protein